jgi:hypothetical protein
MASPWPMIDALMDGTISMRDAGKAFLPQFPQESEDSYKMRRETAVLHPVFKRTVLVNASRPFSRPMKVGDKTPAKVIEWTEDVDLQGTPLAAFSNQVMGACLSKGMFGVLVEFPKATDVKTQAQEKAVGARPYCVRYPANSVLGWRASNLSGGLKLSQLRLLETAEVEDGAYGLKTVEQVRLLEPGKWATYQKDEKNDTWVLIEEGVTTVDFIPFVFFYGIRKAFGIGISPLLDLAFQNVEHWQSASDQQTILHVARVPILFAKCFGDAKLVIGANSAAMTDNENGELTYVEHTGAAIEAGSKSLLDLEDRMRTTGAELISLKPGFATATEISSDGEATKSLLQQICENFEESIEQVLNYMAAWVKLEQTAEVELFKDFGVASNTDPSALSGAKNAGAISAQTHFEELQRRDVISQDRNWDDEQKRIAADTAKSVADAAATAKAVAANSPKQK